MYRRRRVWFFLVAICICLSLYIFEMSRTKRAYNVLYTPWVMRRIYTQKDATEMMIVRIQSAFELYSTSLFLIEPSLLKTIASKRTDDIAFHTRHVVTFGVIGSPNETWKPFCEILKSQGFSANYTTDILIRETMMEQSVTTHILIQRKRHIQPIIHIVVFYRKQQSYLWHSPLPERRLTFAKKAGIHESFTTEVHHLNGINVLTPSPISLFLNGMKESEFIECNFSRAEKFYEQYPKDPKDKHGGHIQREGKFGLAIVRRVFARLGIPFTLSSGSLLGWFRQCDILPYGDVDIEMLITDYTPTIIKALNDAGMRLRHTYGRINDSYELSFETPGHVRFDIFMVYVDENTFWLASVYPPTGAKYKYSFRNYTRCWTTLQDIFVKVPCNPEQYIQSFYGKDWAIPLRKGYPLPNMKRNGHWPRHEWKEVMQSF